MLEGALAAPKCELEPTMTTRISRLFAGALALLLLAGCAGTSFDNLGLGPKQGIGALAGAGAGALAGSQIGGGRGKLVATSVGTLLGAVVGSSVGKSLDRADRIHASRAQYSALEFAPSGAQTSWYNPDSGTSGYITPSRTYQSSSGEYCREYSHNATVDGRIERVYGTACRDSYGAWRAVN